MTEKGFCLFIGQILKIHKREVFIYFLTKGIFLKLIKGKNKKKGIYYLFF